MLMKAFLGNMKISYWLPISIIWPQNALRSFYYLRQNDTGSNFTPFQPNDKIDFPMFWNRQYDHQFATYTNQIFILLDLEKTVQCTVCTAMCT